MFHNHSGVRQFVLYVFICSKNFTLFFPALNICYRVLLIQYMDYGYLWNTFRHKLSCFMIKLYQALHSIYTVF